MFIGAIFLTLFEISKIVFYLESLVFSQTYSVPHYIRRKNAKKEKKKEVSS